MTTMTIEHPSRRTTSTASAAQRLRTSFAAARVSFTWLGVRKTLKPGAFADYRYQADLFPSSLFRVAYDRLQSQYARSADKQYLKILELAAKESEALVEGAIGRLVKLDRPMSFEAVEALGAIGAATGSADDGAGERGDTLDLSAYDQLLGGDAAELGLEVLLFRYAQQQQHTRKKEPPWSWWILIVVGG